MTKEIKKLAKEIKAIEKARNNEDFTVSYDQLCDLRSKLTVLLMQQDSAARAKEKAQTESKAMWDGIFSRIEAKA